MSLTKLERAVLTNLAVNIDKIPQLNVLRLNYTGELAKTDLLVATPTDEGINPIIDVSTSNGYLKKLLTSNGTSICTWSHDNVSSSRVVSNRRTSSSPVTTDLDTVTIAGVFSTAGMIGKRTFDQSTGPMESKANPSYYLTATQDENGLVRFTCHGEGWETNEFTGNDVDTGQMGWPSGWLTWPDLTDTADNGTKLLLRLKTNAADFMTNLPLLCSDTRDGAFLPYLPGTRRFYIYNGLPSTAPYQVIAGYLFGEGDDVWYGRAMTTGGDSRPYRVWNDSYGSFPTAKVVGGASSAISSLLDFRTYYPLSGCPDFINDVVCSVLGSTSSEESLNGTNIKLISMDLEVTSVYGTISTDAYTEYLSSGFGVYEGLSDEQVREIVNTWIPLQGGVAYKIKTEMVGSRSLKELSFYVAYGKMRAKACKDNNYMDLRYNDEYTNKQVDNKLQALSKLSVWIQPTATLTRTQIDAVTKTVTITFPNSTQMSALWSTGTTSKLYTFDEAGISSLIEDSQGYQIVEPTGKLATKLGLDSGNGTLEAYNATIASTRDVSSYDLRFGDLQYGYAASLSDVKENDNVDVEIAFLAAQVTDYVKFNSVVVGLLNSFSFNKVYTRIDLEPAV